MAKLPAFASKVRKPPARPTLLWDGDCGFCRRSAKLLQRQTGDAVAYEPYQTQLERFPEIGEDALAYAVHFVETDGTVHHSAEAVFRALSYAPGHEKWIRSYQKLLPFAGLSELAYRIVAGNRGFFSWVTRMIFGPG